MTALVGGQDGRGEQLVVATGEPLGAARVFPHPRREPSGERFLLVSGGEGLGVVADAAAVLRCVGDGVEPLVQRGVEQRDGVGARGAPLRGESDAPTAAVAQPGGPVAELREVLDVDGGVEHLPTELLDVRTRNPRGAETRGDLRGLELAGQDPLQCCGVGSEAALGIVDGSAGGELRPNVP